MNDQKWESACTTHTSCKYDNHDNIKVNTKDVKFNRISLLTGLELNIWTPFAIPKKF